MLQTHRSLEDLLCNPVMKMISFFCFCIIMEHRWNEIDRGKPKYSERNLSQCHFVHHKSYMDWPGSNPGLRGEKPVTNRLRHGTASVSYITPSSCLSLLNDELTSGVKKQSSMTWRRVGAYLPSYTSSHAKVRLYHINVRITRLAEHWAKSACFSSAAYNKSFRFPRIPNEFSSRSS
jgi:hypothetical protein